MSKGRKGKEKIPAKDVSEGIKICKKRALTFLDSASTLAEKPETANDAGLLTIQAIEELGKAKMYEVRLLKAEENGRPFIYRGGREDDIYNHAKKMNVAFSAMPQPLRKLAMGTFDPSGTFFKTGEMEVSQNLKEYITYTEYENGKWIHPHTINPQQLKELIQGIKETFKQG